MNERNLVPTRRLSARERKVFDRVASEFTHLKSTDEDMLTRFAEASIRYADAAKSTKQHPMVSKPVVNRSTGNIVGETLIRNPLFRSVSEAQSQMNSLGRRLMIDAASENKRLILLSKKARSASGLEADAIAGRDYREHISEEQIEEEIQTTLDRGEFHWLTTDEMRRSFVIWYLTDPYLNDNLPHPGYNIVKINGTEYDLHDSDTPPSVRDSGL